MSKSQIFHIVMSNSGGELDRIVVTVPDGQDHNDKLQDALIKLIDQTLVEPGDIFTVEQH